jgi:hypothetical protein
MKKVFLEMNPNSDTNPTDHAIVHVHPDYIKDAFKIIQGRPYVDLAEILDASTKTRIYIEWSKLYEESDVDELRVKLEELVEQKPTINPPIEADDGSIMGDFQKERTAALGEMFDNPDPGTGIYPTTAFYARLDRAVEKALERQRDIIRTTITT